jgi:hypothetical protein
MANQKELDLLIGANFDGAHLSSIEIDGADFTEVPR